MRRLLFSWDDGKSAIPSHLSVIDEGDTVDVIARADPEFIEPPPGYIGKSVSPGSTARVTLPRDAARELSRKLLDIEPVGQLAGSFPTVLYFRTDQDRAEFNALIKEALPHLVAVKIP